MQQGVLDSASDTFGNILARVPIKVQPLNPSIPRFRHLEPE